MFLYLLSKYVFLFVLEKKIYIVKQIEALHYCFFILIWLILLHYLFAAITVSPCNRTDYIQRWLFVAQQTVLFFLWSLEICWCVFCFCYVKILSYTVSFIIFLTLFYLKYSTFKIALAQDFFLCIIFWIILKQVFLFNVCTFPLILSHIFIVIKRFFLLKFLIFV